MSEEIISLTPKRPFILNIDGTIIYWPRIEEMAQGVARFIQPDFREEPSVDWLAAIRKVARGD